MEESNIVEELDRKIAWHMALQLSLTNHPHLRNFSPEDRDRLNEMLADSINNFIPKPPITEVARQQLPTLRQDGLVQLGQVLTEDKAAEIREYLKPLPVLGYTCPPEKMHGVMGDITDISKKYPFGSYDTEVTLNAPHLLEIFTSPDIIALVTDYLGAHPTFIGCGSWWSFAGNPTPYFSGQGFHRDIDRSRFCSLFIYLSDMTEGDGAHQYVIGTHTVDRFNQIMSRKLPGYTAEQFFKLSDDGYAISDMIRRMFEEETVDLVGKAGTAFIGDTYGIHRGKPPVSKPRLVASCRYCLSIRQVNRDQYKLENLKVPVELDQHSTYLMRHFIC